MSDITLIFPDQLFIDHPCIDSGRIIYLVEEFLFFQVQPFHRQRLILLRASMQRYAEFLAQKGNEVVYISSKKGQGRGSCFDLLGRKKIGQIHLAEFADEWLSQDLRTGAEKYGWTLHFYPSPGFFSSNEELRSFFHEKKRYSMAQFYAHQRKKEGILMKGVHPVGGKYSFDRANRKKLPKNLSIPPPFIPPENSVVKKAAREIAKEFPHAIGDGSSCLYPTSHQEARQALRMFLKERLSSFGDYQDAIEQDQSHLFHSVLSAPLNIGLLTPRQIIEAALEHAAKFSVPLNSLEGFLRQIMGWREFVRGSYLMKGSFQRSSNLFSHTGKIPEKFWRGEVGLLPVDAVIQRVLKTGYSNHIERLMVLGNFLLLAETSPDEIYRWFMAFFVDAYDWVMVPNVYGMSQYADGGAIVSKPYISSSNYILKMSHYPKGEWVEIWDGLFWRFLQKHSSLFSSNIRTAGLLKIMKKNRPAILPKIKKAESWLADYMAKP